jgi:cytosine/creatinine deaminase
MTAPLDFFSATGPLPARAWLAGAGVPRPLREGQRAGPCALLLQDGRIAAIEAAHQGDAPVYELDGATVLPAFVDCHTHLDKGDLLAAGLPIGSTLMQAVEIARRDQATWTANELQQRMDFGLRTALAWGSRAVNTHFDWPETGTPLSLSVLESLREAWRGRIDLHFTALADTALMADAARRVEIASGLRRAGGRLGLFVYPGVRDQDLRQAFSLAAREDLVLDLHIDEHLSPPVTHLGLVAQLTHEWGLAGRVICSHACVLQSLPPSERDRTLEQLAAAGVGLVALPYTNLYLQDSGQSASGTGQRTTPRQRGILPVHEARALGIPVAFGSDNHRDPFFPAGDLDLLQLLALAALAAQLDDPAERWSDAVCTIPARMLQLDWDGMLRPGVPADLVIHPGRTSAEVMSRAAIGRRVLRTGQPLNAGEAVPPDLRALDNLRRHVAEGSPA